MAQSLMLKIRDLRLREGRDLPQITQPGSDRESTAARSLDPTLVLRHSSFLLPGLGGGSQPQGSRPAARFLMAVCGPFALWMEGFPAEADFAVQLGKEP